MKDSKKLKFHFARPKQPRDVLHPGSLIYSRVPLITFCGQTSHEVKVVRYPPAAFMVEGIEEEKFCKACVRISKWVKPCR